MTPRLQGQRALVTGAATRLGRVIARALAAQGVDLVLHYHSNRAGAEQARDELAALGVNVELASADLTDRRQARELVASAAATLGGLDLLVASAANFERVELAAVDDEAWDRSLDLNLSSQFSLAHAALPHLRTSRGSIVFITCSSATTPFRNYLPYVVAKGGLRHLMRTLALEAAPEVRVNAVAPGTVLPAEGTPPELLDRIKRRIPLARLGAPEDVAEAVVFLASASFITGHEIVVDGGRSLAAVETFG
ncbi:MAG TPA: SDR family oxidoreductase [Polyangiaceae bacterium]|nr:SDR family oxidoreductase [Polyangiaceae bacterium]